jgi:hypothetical protein
MENIKVDSLSVYRQQVAAENNLKPVMSDKAKAKLREQNEQERELKTANAAFLAAFKKLPKDTVTLASLLKRILKADQIATTVGIKWDGDDVVVTPVQKAPIVSANVLERMANKLLQNLSHGYVPTSVGDVVLLGELTQDEAAMSDDKFYRHLEGSAPKTPVALNAPTGNVLILAGVDVEGLNGEHKNRIWHVGLNRWLDEHAAFVMLNGAISGASKPTEKQEETGNPSKTFWTAERCRKNGLCKSGILCVHASGKGRKPAKAVEGKQFCGKICQEAYPIRVRNQRQRDLVN